MPDPMQHNQELGENSSFQNLSEPADLRIPEARKLSLILKCLPNTKFSQWCQNSADVQTPQFLAVFPFISNGRKGLGTDMEIL